jgi:hypothetical protein
VSPCGAVDAGGTCTITVGTVAVTLGGVSMGPGAAVGRVSVGPGAAYPG